MTPLETAGGLVAALGAYELLRWRAVRAVRSRLNDSVEGFIQQHNVQLDHFRFIDRIWVRQTLLLDPELGEETAARARATGVSLLALRGKIDEWLDEIVPYFNILSYYKLGGAVAQAATNACYELVFDAASLEAARAQIPRGAVTVYVANHRSNADYVVLSVGAMRQVALSYAVGEWARVWPLDVLFRSFGSYFVRRGEKDPLYHRVLERYLQLVAARGLTTAFFLEGGLTRDGLLREPKIGLLDYLIGVLRREPEREIVFIPVGINYDRVLEDRNLLANAKPTEKAKWRSLGRMIVRAPGYLLAFFARAAVRSHRKQGYAAVSFGPAIPLRSFLPDAATIARLPDKQRRPYIARAADHLLARVQEVVPATPVALVATALLAGVRDVTGLVRALREQLLALDAAKRPVARGAAFRRLLPTARVLDEQKALLDADIADSEDAERMVDLALILLRRRALVEGPPEALRLAPDAPDILAFYANSLCAPTHMAYRPPTPESAPAPTA